MSREEATNPEVYKLNQHLLEHPEQDINSKEFQDAAKAYISGQKSR
jgi:hypothetical protein